MIYCSSCGKPNEDDAVFCSSCGKQINSIKKSNSSNNAINDTKSFSLASSNMRDLDISISNGIFHISGKYYYLRNMNFYPNNGKSDVAYVKDYLGCGYVTKRSYGKCISFVVWAIIFQIVKSIYDAICRFASNHYYNTLFSFMNSLQKPVKFVYVSALIICFACLVRYIFDKKKVVDIAFTNKRFAIPQSLISEREVHELKSVLENKNS